MAACFFEFLISELIINDHAAAVRGGSIDIIFTGIEYLDFALSRLIFEVEATPA